jgi:hypothetical protein
MGRSVLLGAVVAVAIGAAGCGGTTKQRTGTLAGTFGIYGPGTVNACGCVLTGGTLRLLSSSHSPIVLNVSRSGKFSARVPIGRYRVEAGTHAAANWPMGSCHMLLVADKTGTLSRFDQRSVTVRRSQTTEVAVGCVDGA